MNKNIFYVSTTSSDVYPNNSRSKFTTVIDKNELEYLPKGNISAAIKTVMYDNNYNIFEPNMFKPDMIIAQKLEKTEKLYYQLDEEAGEAAKPYWEELEPSTMGDPVLGEGCDYLLETGGEMQLKKRKPFYENEFKMKRRKFRNRNFTDIQLYFTEYMQIIHNIHIDEMRAESNTDFVKRFQQILSSINYYAADEESDAKHRVTAQVEADHISVKAASDVYISKRLKVLLGAEHMKKGSLFRKVAEQDFPKRQTWHMKEHTILFSDLTRKGIARQRYPTRGAIVASELYERLEVYTSPQPNEDVYCGKFVDGLLHTTWDERYYLIRKQYQTTDSEGKMPAADIKKTFSKILGIRSNVKDQDISSSQFDRFMTFIHAAKVGKGTQRVEMEKPIFFKTTLERLSKASFEIVDLDTKEQPAFSVGTPTYLQVIVSTKIKFQRQFTMFLESGESLKYFPSNTNMDFTIKLPERLEFNRNWLVSLKALFIANKFYNIYAESCWIKVVKFGDSQIYRRQGIVYPRAASYITEETHRVPDGRKTSHDLGRSIREIFKKIGLNCHLNMKAKKYVIEGRRSEDKILCLSPALGKIMGYEGSGSREVLIDLFHLKRSAPIQARFGTRMRWLLPKNLIVGCDVVETSVLGSAHVKVLRSLATAETKQAVSHINFSKNEFVGLSVKEFENIRVLIKDTTGQVAKTVSTQPTRLQLLFSTDPDNKMY